MSRLKPKQPTLGSSSSSSSCSSSPSTIKETKQQILSSAKLIALGFLESFVGLAYVCAKQTSCASRKLQAAFSRRLQRYKAMRKCAHLDSDDDDNSPLWQRTILMGDKCQPLDFSGVIYYDADGNQVAEPPGKFPYSGRYAIGRIGHGRGGLYSSRR